MGLNPIGHPCANRLYNSAPCCVWRFQASAFHQSVGEGSATSSPQPNTTQLYKVLAGDKPLCSLFKSVACGPPRGFHILGLNALQYGKMFSQNIRTKL